MDYICQETQVPLIKFYLRIKRIIRVSTGPCRENISKPCHERTNGWILTKFIEQRECWLKNEHSKFQISSMKNTRENIENISNVKKYKISAKYQFLDEIFLRVLEKHPEKMSDIFFKMFKASPKTVIKFLSNKSNFFEDLKIILKMPKWIFIKALFY